MAEFDEQILAIRKFVRDREARGQPLSTIRAPVGFDDLLRGLPVRFGSGNVSPVILQEDTSVELGNPVRGSASMVLWTRQAELIRDGLIVRMGPDIPESEGQSLPFGQVLLLGAGGLQERDLAGLERASNLGSLLEGYMIRHVPRKLWSRVSREAAAKGFCFETLGRAIMAHYRRSFSLLEKVEVLFVTSSKEDVLELEEIGLQAKGRSLAIRKLSRSEEGVYECDDLSCDDCPEKPTCDTIREVLVIRRKGKVVGIEVVRDQGKEGAAKKTQRSPE